jgi:signal transduction histidine kinase
MKHLRHIIVAVTFFLLANYSIAQDSLTNTCADISTIKLQKNIIPFVSSAFIEKNGSPEKVFSSIVFVPGIQYKTVVPNTFVTKQLLLKFNLINRSDTAATVYFFPGFYYQEIKLYKVTDDGLTAIPSVLPSLADSMGFRSISLQTKDSVSIVAALTFIKTYNNVIRPKLVSSSFLPSFISQQKNNHSLTDLITYILCGLLLMMILFSLSNYFQGANPEFLFYSGYAFFLGTMLFLMARYNYRTNLFSYFLESYLDFILQMTGIVFYIIFMQRFLNTRNKHPFLYKLYGVCLALSCISILSYTLFHYFSNNFIVEYLIENVTKVVLLLMVIVFLIYSVRHWDDKLLRYVFWGNFCLFIFSLISQLSAFMQDILNSLPGIFSSSVFYYELGLFLELVFFLAGLNHKNRRQLIIETKERENLKAQNLLKEYEKEIAVYKAQQEERERISADMHDELGSGMTAIRLMSEIARNKMKENTPIEIEKISRSANDVLNKMNAIIWSMNSGNDTLDNLISYIRSYALEYFDGTTIDCKVNTPQNIPVMELTGDKRRNIFLCIKETLNNALKHSNASLIIIDIEINHQLKVTIADNGTGIDLQNIRQFGNGLKNIGRRMESIGGTFKIENNKGTVTTLELPM